MSYALDKVKLMIIDDMKPMLSLTESILRVFGFKNIFTAANGEDAFRIICKEDPDLIITDWVMEPMDGLELANMIRKNPLTPNPYVPILMMTGFSSRLRVEKARDMGITEFLVKPFTSQDLYNRVVQIIEKPRQFVDAGDFFGPDRRRKRAQDYQGPRRRDDDQDSKDPQTQEQKSVTDILKRLREEAKNVSD